MTHEEALNLILAHTCRTVGDPFTFDLHCAEAVIVAKLISSPGEFPIKYEIETVKVDTASGLPCGCPSCKK